MTGSDFYWEIFKNTGSPTAYLLYKDNTQGKKGEETQ
ncbi:MAG: YqzL family protein [Candidatus Eremiobacteraeota bacterium]|nr:YqzL family protein [Candidatus Eremiobacteraeota bacterium]